MPRNQSESDSQILAAAIDTLVEVEKRWMALLRHVANDMDTELLNRALEIDSSALDPYWERSEELWEAICAAEDKLDASKSK